MRSKIFHGQVLSLIAIAAVVALPAEAQQSFRWPNGKKAAIVLTYDDALRSQLDVAIPQLDAEGLKGTFFLNGTFAPEDVVRWRAAAAAGHELGNHSMFHPCPAAAFPSESQFHAENYSVAGMLREIGAMNTLLFALDGKKSRTYGVPCSQTIVGGHDYIDALRLSGLVRYARTGGDANAVITAPNNLDPFHVPSRMFSTLNSAADLIAFAESVRKSGGMGVFMFHGVGGDYLNVSAEMHRALLLYLKQHEAEIWIGTFQEVMDFVKSPSHP
jgi:peptidoglycan/xylan/chitin deacetylase (PgdA/CDA1 family)